MAIIKGFVCCFVISLLVACGDTYVQEYTMSKESVPPPMQDSEADPIAGASQQSQTGVVGKTVADPRHIKWTAPAEWTDRGAGGMRLASYATPDAGDVSVISFPGAAGGFEANVNRWREQVGLAPLPEAALMKEVTKIPSAIGPFLAMRLINTKNSEKAISAAIYQGAGFTLFVKLSGTVACIEKHSQGLFDFCAKAQSQ